MNSLPPTSETATLSPKEQPENVQPSDLQDHSLLRHGIWVFVGRFANVAIIAASTFIIARVLSPTEFGRFSSVLAATQLLSLIGIFGLDQAVLREVGRSSGLSGSKQIRQLLKAFGLVAVCSITISIFLSIGFFAEWGQRLTSEPMSAIAICIAVLFVAARAINLIAGETCRALDRPMAANLLGGNTFGPLATLIFLITLVTYSHFQGVNWVTAVGIYFAAALIPIGFQAFAIVSTARQLPFSRDGESITHLACRLGKRSAIPLFLISIVSFTYYRADVLILSFFQRPEEVATYEAARRLTLLLFIPLNLANVIVVSSIARLHASARLMELQTLLQRLSAIAAIPCLGVCILFLAVPESVLRLLFGEEYVGAATILRLLVPGQVVCVLTGTCGLTLIHTGRARIPLTIAILAAIFVIVASPLAITWYGSAGLAVVVSLSLSFENGMNWWLAGTMAGIWTHPRFRYLYRLNLPHQ
jgi:O-antigen/teichoic acid export membrane protein